MTSWNIQSEGFGRIERGVAGKNEDERCDASTRPRGDQHGTSATLGLSRKEVLNAPQFGTTRFATEGYVLSIRRPLHDADTPKNMLGQ